MHPSNVYPGNAPDIARHPLTLPRETARQYSQEQLLPRVTEAYRNVSSSGFGICHANQSLKSLSD